MPDVTAGSRSQSTKCAAAYSVHLTFYCIHHLFSPRFCTGIRWVYIYIVQAELGWHTGAPHLSDTKVRAGVSEFSSTSSPPRELVRRSRTRFPRTAACLAHQAPTMRSADGGSTCPSMRSHRANESAEGCVFASSLAAERARLRLGGRVIG